MNDAEQVTAFSDELDKLVERFRLEFDMSYAQVIGVFQMKSWLLMKEANGRKDEI